MIEKVVAAAVKAAGEWYGVSPLDSIESRTLSLEDIEPDLTPMDDPTPGAEPSPAPLIELPDGRKAKVNVKLPPNFKTGA